MKRIFRGQSGQASVLLVGAMCAVLVGAVVLGAVASASTLTADRRQAADLAALAAAGAMRRDYPRLYPAPGLVALAPAAYEGAARTAAQVTASANGVRVVTVSFPGATQPPLRVRVQVAGSPAGSDRRSAAVVAEAELRLPAVGPALGAGGAGEYRGPFAYRDGKPMRPDTALAYDRMASAARAAGVDLVVVSGYRSDAEQAMLFAQHPDPKWVARPGQSLHRLGTELDLGPASAYGWLAAHAPTFHFIRRYAWEPWHYGLNLNPGSASVGYGGSHEAGGSSLPSFVPARYAPMLARAAQRWNVSGGLLGAQIEAESGFDPNSRSPAGALGIAQFMPGTARTYGLANPMDPAQSIDAQGHLMRDLLRQFGSVPLALAAYNAGPGRVVGCMCIPAIPETQAYVARILGLLRASGDGGGLALDGLQIRLVR